jgi:hypothetical protein
MLRAMALSSSIRSTRIVFTPLERLVAPAVVNL